MGLGQGPGHRYFVHVIKHFYGTIELCIEFMNDNFSSDPFHWFELHPQVSIKDGTCIFYMCDLVEMCK